jgi:hypothetical protein
MRYSFEKIDTVQACDTLLIRACKKKQNLERRRRNLGEAIARFRERIDKLDQESNLLQMLLGVFTTAYRALPEGKYKAGMNVKVKRLEVRQAMVEKKAYSCNVASLLVKELKYDRLNSQVLAMELYINTVRETRTELSKATLHVIQSNRADFSTLPQASFRSELENAADFRALYPLLISSPRLLEFLQLSSVVGEEQDRPTGKDSVKDSEFAVEACRDIG